MAEGSSVQSYGVKMLSLMEKREDLKAGLDNDTYIDNDTHIYWKIFVATASAEGTPTTPTGKGKGKGKVGGSQQSKANDVCIHCQGKGHWKRKCPQLFSNPGMFVVEVNIINNTASWVLDTSYGAHISNNLQVLERSKRPSKDEMILRLGDGKAVAPEAVGSLNLVISDHIWIELKDYYYVPSMIKHIISIPILDNNGYAFKIDKMVFYLMIDNNSHLLVLRRSTRESQPIERYEFVGLTSQLDNYPKTYRGAMSDIDSDKWLEAMKPEMDSMGSNQVWTFIDLPKGVKPVGYKWVYICKLGAKGELQPSRLGSWRKDILNDPGSILRKPTDP
ncbi:UNVERIFIED_CONTAM: hypothetical protein Scaly_2745700 [Sesamum calycinum]|uniref:Retrovirus-related Pol polyprotein from transposon TNT 1-94-like beta-barrel domain-containing protein n=1 Tax=Sesamum calycinum TaxID=2727403 RepID=A0AAW2J380_9LAMI